jgi:hypothetical protein
MSENPEIDLIISSTGCTLDEAELAWKTSEENHEKALQVVELIRSKYLAIKCHFTGSGKQSIEGIFLLLLEDKSLTPLYASTAVMNYPETQLEVNAGGDILYWSQLIASKRRDQSRMNMESSIELEEFLRNNILPDPALQLWNESKQIKVLRNSSSVDTSKLIKISDLQKSIDRTIKLFVSTFYNQPLSVESDTELVNNLRFGDIAIALGLIVIPDEALKVQEKVQEKPKERKFREPVIVHMRGRMVLDITEGILAKDLRKGDRISIDIVDNSSMAGTIVSMLGLVENGSLKSTWGYVSETEEAGTDRRRILVQIAKNVFVETVSMNDIRIKCKRKYPAGCRSEFVLHSPSSVPGYVVVAGLALFFTILLKVFMVMFNP